MDIRKNWFYCVLGAIFAVLITINIVYSYRGHEDSFTLSVVPMPEGNVDSTLISFRTSDKGSVLKWTTIIDRFLDQYRQHGTKNLVPCSFNSGPLREEQVCDVPVDDFHPCTSAYNYNYDSRGLCVFLHHNNIVNWKPEPYNTTEDLPEDMPLDLKQHIRMVSGKPEANTVWVSCKGENPTDMENMGPVQYIPRRGFSPYYYPFTNKEGYLSPLVAVFFENPRTGTIIKIECRAWARNIVENRLEQHGSVHFELSVDS